MIAKQIVPANATYLAGFSEVFNPKTFDEAMTLAKFISTSSFCPKSMANKPADILLALQLGLEISLSPMQALQNIAVINGKPCIWGDAALAVVQRHPDYINHREWFEGTINDGNRIAYCAITRKNSTEHVIAFSMQDAKKAMLWAKQGPWTQYPDRMLQMRARGFCIRDKFADALKGLITREEAQDYPVAPIVQPKVIQEIKQDDPSKVEIEVIDFEVREKVLADDKEEIANADSLDDLEKVFKAKYRFYVGKQDKDALQEIVKAKDARKDVIQKTIEDFQKELNDETV